MSCVIYSVVLDNSIWHQREEIFIFWFGSQLPDPYTWQEDCYTEGTVSLILKFEVVCVQRKSDFSFGQSDPQMPSLT